MNNVEPMLCLIGPNGIGHHLKKQLLFKTIATNCINNKQQQHDVDGKEEDDDEEVHFIMERTTTEGRNRWRWSGVELDRDHTHKISNHNGLRWNDGLEWNNRDQRTGWIKMADGRRRRRRRRRRMDRDGSGWIEVDRGGSGWIEVDRDGSGWIGMDGSGGSECMKGSGRNNDGNPKDRKTMLINEIARNGMEKRDSTL
eukprot:NP_492155.3 Uncharacterized protein CELE_VH15N14R.1 [Caenorhabditis elegans]